MITQARVKVGIQDKLIVLIIEGEDGFNCQTTLDQKNAEIVAADLKKAIARLHHRRKQ